MNYYAISLSGLMLTASCISAMNDEFDLNLIEQVLNEHMRVSQEHQNLDIPLSNTPDQQACSTDEHQAMPIMHVQDESLGLHSHELTFIIETGTEKNKKKRLLHRNRQQTNEKTATQLAKEYFPNCPYEECDSKALVFTSEQSLTKHIQRKHMYKKSFPCPHEDCPWHEMPFDRSDNLKTHLKCKHNYSLSISSIMDTCPSKNEEVEYDSDDICS